MRRLFLSLLLLSGYLFSQENNDIVSGDMAIFIVIIVVILILLVLISIKLKKGKDKEKHVNVDDTLPSIFDSYGDETTALKTYGYIDIFYNEKLDKTYKITENDLIIGRDPSRAQIIISEPIISKSHCTFFIRDDKVYVKDNNSTNGTYVKGERIIEYELNNDDIITLGKKGTVKIHFYEEQTKTEEETTNEE